MINNLYNIYIKENRLKIFNSHFILYIIVSLELYDNCYNYFIKQLITVKIKNFQYS